MAEIDVLKAQIVRQDGAVGWGLTLAVSIAGGTAPHLTIQRILPGSPASRIGLKPGDVVTEIGDTPTAGMTAEQATLLTNQHAESLILTIERKARGGIPPNPVVQTENPQLKQYQTYDMTGVQPKQRTRQNQPTHQTQQTHVDYSDLSTAVSRPFQEPPRGSRTYQPSPASQQTNPYATSLPPLRPPPRQPGYSSPPVLTAGGAARSQHLVAEEDKVDTGVSQSRTFRVLSSLMSNEEPYVGVQGLPPPRSAAMERMRQQNSPGQASPGSPGGAGGPGQQRVKVFMPQQYNNPMSLYSAPNVVETFAAQAEGLMDELDHA